MWQKYLGYRSTISTHALREEGDDLTKSKRRTSGGFLPTPSARRATLFYPTASSRTGYFYPRPPRGGRRSSIWSIVWLISISTHALREEGDPVLDPLRRTTHISTHALREEGDRMTSSSSCARSIFLPTPSARRATVCAPDVADVIVNFYPRPPRGGRPPAGLEFRGNFAISTHALREEGDACRWPTGVAYCAFLPTPSARRATLDKQEMLSCVSISTHALREEGDPSSRASMTPVLSGFLPTPSARRATCPPQYPSNGFRFLPTPSARRATCQSIQTLGVVVYFYPRPPRGGRPEDNVRQEIEIDISTHALREEGDPGQNSHYIQLPYFYPRPPRGGRQ